MQKPIHSPIKKQPNHTNQFIELMKCYQTQAVLLKQAISQQLSIIGQTKSKVKSILLNQIGKLKHSHDKFKQDIQQKWHSFQSQVMSIIENICIEFLKQIICVEEDKILWKSKCHELEKQLIFLRSEDDENFHANQRQLVVSPFLPCVQEESFETTIRESIGFKKRQSLKNQKLPKTRQITHCYQLPTINFEIPELFKDQNNTEQQQSEPTSLIKNMFGLSYSQDRTLQIIQNAGQKNPLTSKRELRYQHSQAILHKDQNKVKKSHEKITSLDKKRQNQNGYLYEKLSKVAASIAMCRNQQNNSHHKKIFSNSKQKPSFKVLKDSRMNDHIFQNQGNSTKKIKELFYKSKKSANDIIFS